MSRLLWRVKLPNIASGGKDGEWLAHLGSYRPEPRRALASAAMKSPGYGYPTVESCELVAKVNLKGLLTDHVF
jgi:hypothetical protein